MSVQSTTVRRILSPLLEIVTHRIALYYLVDKRQSTPLAPNASFADTCEVAVEVKAVLTEYRHDTTVLHPAVFHDTLENELPDGRGLFHLRKPIAFHGLGYREKRPGIEPAGDIVVAAMIE